MRVILASVLIAVGVTGASADPASQCRKVRNDDNVRPYDATLQPGFIRAYQRLFPKAQTTPDPQMLAAEANYRCMDGRLYACFTGANLPCAKIAASRQNPGANEYCRNNPNAEIVPMVATGHDTPFSYRCKGGRAEISAQNLTLDSRGFAKELWAPLN